MDGVFQIKIINNLDIDILLKTSFNYPDTTIPESKSFTKIKSKGFFTESLSSTADDLRDEAKSDTISFFFLDKKIVETEPWDSIRKNYEILARKEIWVEDLIRTREVVYP